MATSASICAVVAQLIVTMQIGWGLWHLSNARRKHHGRLVMWSDLLFPWIGLLAFMLAMIGVINEDFPIMLAKIAAYLCVFDFALFIGAVTVVMLSRIKHCDGRERDRGDAGANQ